MWGSVVGGKCGLGDIVDEKECYCSVPTKVMVGADDKRVIGLSCGSGHTAVVTESGQLYVFGCGNGGRLGLGYQQYDDINKPTLVTSLLHEKISAVSCGNAVTLALSAIKSAMVGDEDTKFRKLVGGRVYLAGSRNVLGKQCDTFQVLESMKDIPIKQVSAGFRHNVLVSTEGELFCWGHNVSGCLGLPESVQFAGEPIILKSLHSKAEKISLRCKAKQSSVYNQREASSAVNGEISGRGVKQCSCTQLDHQAWIELDLGEIANIETIKVWNRTDFPADRSQRSDYYTSRLFPCWIMLSNDPFLPLVSSLKENLDMAISSTRFSENQRLSTWNCPIGTQGRYVRLQLEGENFLNVAEIEVFGHLGINSGVGRVSYAVAGRDVTVVVLRPSNDPKYIESAYCRAVYADARNADILRQLETYALEYDKFGRGEVLANKCSICVGSIECETCCLNKQFSVELERVPPTLGGRRHTLQEIDDYLINQERPPLEVMNVPLRQRPGFWRETGRQLLNRMRKNIGLKYIVYEIPLQPLEDSSNLGKAIERDEEVILSDELLDVKRIATPLVKGVLKQPKSRHISSSRQDSKRYSKRERRQMKYNRMMKSKDRVN